MATPYNGAIGMIYWDPSSVGENTIDDVIKTMQDFAPNVKAIWIKTSDGTRWQGQLGTGKPDLRINGVADITRWVTKFKNVGIDVHGWCVLNGLDIPKESDLVIQACKGTGLKSMVLDIEVGDGYFRGGPGAARNLGIAIRRGLGGEFHLGLCLDARGTHPKDIYIDEWFPFVNSFHPMTYWRDFGVSPEEAVTNAYTALQKYGKPIIPMLQAYGLKDQLEIPRAADAAFRGKNAEGISLFRLGTIAKDGFDAIQRITMGGGEEPPDVITFDYTNQTLIDAVTKAAKFRGVDPAKWIVSAGLTDELSKPNDKYVGYPPEKLPGLTVDERNLVVKALSGDPLNATDNIVGRVTNQQLINAFSEAARQINQRDRFWDYVKAAGLESLADNRQAIYTGVPITNLPNLTDDFKNRLIQQLGTAPVVTGTKILPVPWISQLGAGAPGGFDCGQTCVLMLLKYYKKVNANMTVGQLTTILDGKTNYLQLRDLAKRFGLTLSTMATEATLDSVDKLREPVAQGRPVILLVNYADLGFPVHLVSGVNQGWHWLVVVGYSNDQMVVHDPLWTITSRFPNGGAGLFIARPTLKTAIRPYPALY